MLRLTLDYIPFGNWSRTQRIGSLILTNDGTASAGLGNYEVEMQLCAIVED